MSVVISRGFPIVEFHVSGSLVLIELEVEVRFSLNLSVNILSETFLLLSLNLFIKAERIKLLLKESVDSFLDILDVFVIVVIDG